MSPEDSYGLLSGMNLQVVTIRGRIHELKSQIAMLEDEGQLLDDLVDCLLLWERTLRAHLQVRKVLMGALAECYPMVKDNAGPRDRLCGRAADSTEAQGSGGSDTLCNDACA